MAKTNFKKTKPKFQVWKHFTEYNSTDGKAKMYECNYCKAKYSLF